MIEVERDESHLSGQLGAGRSPAQTPGNHQVNDGVKIAVERKNDALSRASHAYDGAPEQRGRLRVERPQHERARNAQRVELVASRESAKPLDVDRNVGKLGHPVNEP